MSEYLIWSHEHSAWWGPGGCGYTQSLTKAGRYTQSDAIYICVQAMPGTSSRLGALPELPVRLTDVEAMVEAYDARFGDRPEPWR